MSQDRSPIPWNRFVALGDSLTEGIGDPAGGRLRGWADRLTVALRQLNPTLRYWNLAKRSLTTSQIREAQLERALELEPDLVSVVVGMNDVLAPNFEREAFRRDLIDIVGPLRETRATVLLGTLPRDLPLLRVMIRSKADALRERLSDVSNVVLSVVREEEIPCMDAPEGWRYTMSECSIDGCHPNARGHAHIAELALEALARNVGVDLPPFEYVDCGRFKSSVGHLRWLASHGLARLPAFVKELRAEV